jgi:quercetin dioxygenase-like cupin family protein
VSYPDTPGGTAIRHECAELIRATEKYVVSNTVAPEDLAPWQDTTRIIRSADLYAEIAALKARPGRPILIQLSRQLLTIAQSAFTLPGMGETGASLTVLARTGADGSGLVRTLAEIPAGGRHAGTAGVGGELWFVIEGSGRLDLDGAPGPALVADRGLWIPAGAAYLLECDRADGLRVDTVALPAASWPADRDARSAANGPDVPLSRDLRDCPAEMTADRTFWVLFGPGRDCAAATQFVGEIPPGRAPEHSHPYDEVVLILQGSGVAHLGALDRQLSAGTCLHLPPGLRHCLENSGPQLMRVLGVFHPADSPAAKLAHSPTPPG